MSAGLSDRKVDFKKVALIGTGLIGGSIGMAIKEKKIADEIICYDLNRKSAENALIAGAADRQENLLHDAVSDADLIIMAVPVLSSLEILKEICQYLKNGALITDVGSTKSSIMAAAEQLLPDSVYYIGGHPMAGSEESGIEGADPGLLENAIYVLTPLGRTPAPVVIKLENFLLALGAQPYLLDPLDHDRIVAHVSHLPHIIATALVRSVAGAGNPEVMRALAAGGFRDSTRIALGNPEIWRDICISNRWAILAALKSFKKNIDDFEKFLSKPEAEAVEIYLHQARDFRRTIPYRGKGILPELYEIIVLVRDTPGTIGKITSLLGYNGINIDSIEILHVRELTGGSIKIGFRIRESQKIARQLLEENGYRVFEK